MSSSMLESASQVAPTSPEQATEIMAETSGSVLRVQLNRPAKKNAMTFNMYASLAKLLNDAAKDDAVRVVVLHGAGDSFSAGNDLEDFLHASFPMDGNSPQGRYIAALINFNKPLIAAVHGAAVG